MSDAIVELDRMVGIPLITPTTDFRRRARRRAGALSVATIVGVAVTAGGVAILRAEPRRTSSAPAAPEIQELPEPGWYQAVARLLPTDYRHIALTESNDLFVRFEAFDPMSSKSLFFDISRGPMAPDPSGSMSLVEAQLLPWSDPNVDHNISLPDGRQMGLYCGVRGPSDDEQGCSDLGGAVTDPETLRATALALALELSPDDLPPPAAALAHVPVSSIHAAADSEVPAEDRVYPEMMELDAPHYAFTHTRYSDLFNVSTLTGLYPPLPTDTSRTRIAIGDSRLVWQPMSNGAIWFVSSPPGGRHDAADRILDRALDLNE